MKKAYHIIGLLIFIGLLQITMIQDIKASSNSNIIESDSGKVYETAQIMPEFPGGIQAQMKFFAEKIVYPEMVKEKNIQGTVFLSCIVEKDGHLTNFQAIRSPNIELTKEVIRVAKLMPHWIAGQQDGKKVRVRIFLPVKFTLQKDIIIDEEVEIMPEEDTTMKKEDEIYVFVEDNAEFPGGEKARIKYFQENIKYPEKAKELGIEGVVYIKFVVEKDGSITNVKVLRGIGGGCDEEAMRVIRSMPRWSPAKHRGKPVRVYYNLPVKYTLYSGEKTKKKRKNQE